MNNELKSFMNSLWNCTDVVVPGLGTIVSTRAKYGTDIQATLLDNGTISLLDGTELFARFPNLFEEEG
jgi:hypothetical protein